MWSWKCWLSKVCPKLNGFFEKLMIIFFVLLVHLAINSNIIWSSLFYGLEMHWAKRCFIFQNQIFFNEKEWYEDFRSLGNWLISSFRVNFTSFLLSSKIYHVWFQYTGKHGNEWKYWQEMSHNRLSLSNLLQVSFGLFF